MYIPTAFQEHDLGAIHEVMRRHGFATLVTHGPEGLFGTHLPLLLDAGRGPFGTLRGHVARGNPHWEYLGSGAEALVIFHGPHAYVSPSWYEAELSVPTWNYVAVHAYGSARLLDDAGLRGVLRDLVSIFEGPRAEPWVYALPEEFQEKMIGAIVGFEIEITRLEGKFKLSQNRQPADRSGVRAALMASADATEAAVGQLMQAREATDV